MNTRHPRAWRLFTTFTILPRIFAGASVAFASSPGSVPFGFFRAPSNPGLQVLAGNTGGPGRNDGQGSSARFQSPRAVVADSSGNVYLSDNASNIILKISSTAQVTVLAGAAGVTGSTNGTGTAALFNGPTGMALDSSGNLFVADQFNNAIRKITPAGVVTTFAGGTSGSANGSGTAAQFNYPVDLTCDSSNNLFVADQYNFAIRKITPGGVVTTLAGGSNGSSDGTGAAAQFSYPNGVVVDASGNVFVADSSNYTIRKVTSGGVVTTLAGLATNSGATDGTGSAARFGYLPSITIGAAGNLYVSDSNNGKIRKVTTAGVVTTFAGSGVGSADGVGAAASFNNPLGLTADPAGVLYLADGNFTVRKIKTDATVSTWAGKAQVFGAANGTGTAARFLTPMNITLDSGGTVIVADSGNSSIRRVTAAGVVTTLAGSSYGSNDGNGAGANFATPVDVIADPAGNVYVADIDNNNIRKITPAGDVSTLAGDFTSDGSADGTGTNATFYQPTGVAVDGSGNVFVADRNNQTIRKITPAGVVTTFAGLAANSGSTDATGTAARFSYPCAVRFDGSGNLLVADQYNHTIRKITTGGVVTTLAGSAGNAGYVNGTGTSARFNAPTSLAVDTAGNLFVGDSGNYTIRKVTPAGVVTTVVGAPAKQGVSLGALPASVNVPNGVAVSTTKLFISSENAILVAPKP